MCAARSLLSLLAGCSAGARRPGGARWPATVDVVDNDFTPRELRVVPGETVTWLFKGLQDHTVTSDPGQAESLQLGPAKSGRARASRTRSTRWGASSTAARSTPTMNGAVVVAPPDLTAPSLTRLSASPARFCVPGRRCRHAGTRFRFRLSEASRVRGSIATVRRPGRRLRRLSARLGAGTRSIRFRGRGLSPGRYLVRLQATDDGGQPSPVKRVRFRVKRP